MLAAASIELCEQRLKLAEARAELVDLTQGSRDAGEGAGGVGLGLWERLRPVLGRQPVADGAADAQGAVPGARTRVSVPRS